jgi:hypothetical protein
MKYYKIIKEDRIHYRYKFTEGLNTDPLPWNPDANCEPGGFYFSDAKHICEYLEYGPWICEVKIPKDTKVIKGENKYKAHQIRLGKFRDLRKVNTWKWMVNEGIDIHTWNDYPLRWAIEKGYLDTVKFLVKNGADIHAFKGYALRLAADYDYLDIVKFLVKRGVDVHAWNDRAICMAASRGHLDIVKFLVENGANIHACEDWPLRLAAINGYLDVVEYLETK